MTKSGEAGDTQDISHKDVQCAAQVMAASSGEYLIFGGS